MGHAKGRSPQEINALRKKLTKGKIKWGTAFPEKIGVGNQVLKQLGYLWKNLDKIKQEEEVLKETFKRRHEQLDLEMKLNFEKSPETVVSLYKLINDGIQKSDYKAIKQGTVAIRKWRILRMRSLYRLIDHVKHNPAMNPNERNHFANSFKKELDEIRQIKGAIEEFEKWSLKSPFG